MIDEAEVSCFIWFGSCSEFSRRVKNGLFFATLQLPGFGCAPSKRQKIRLFLPTAENPEQAVLRISGELLYSRIN
jgi:hypothetical protein